MPSYIEQTRNSPYLETLLVPAIGPRPIPDDIMKEHTSKAETTTYNITSPASGSGLFIIYPNNNTGLIGTHYIFNGTTYVYDATTGPLTTAQDLYNNYNYGRLISQIVTIKSSTLPAGVYALNGTFNAINVYNTLSEVSTGLTYNNILSLNNNITDKIGNVLVGDGLALLSLPQTFGKPYTRFNDPTPFTSPAGTTPTRVPTMVDDDASMVNISDWTVATPVAGNVVTTLCTINFDSTTPIQIEGRLTINHVVNAEIILVARFLDAFGAVIFSTNVVSSYININSGNITRLAFDYNYTGSYYTNRTQPVAAVQFAYSLVGAATQLQLNVGIRPLGASNAGTNQPITLVAYQGVAAGSQLTISGITNYELVPNSNLKKNIKTEYGHYDPSELDYVKRILMNKDKFSIRTVQALPDYNRNKEVYRDLYMLDSDVVARSFSWNSLLKTIKDIVLKGAASVFPLASPVINVVDELATNLTDKYVKSAGGAPIIPAVGRASGGRPIARAKNHIHLFAKAMDSEDTSLLRLRDEGKITSQQLDSIRNELSGGGTTNLNMGDVTMRNSTGATVLDLESMNTVAVPFVVIISEGHRNVGCMLYVAVKGNFSTFLPKGMRDYYSLSKNGYKVHGRLGDQVDLNLISDVTLMPVSQIEGNKVLIPTIGHPVVEDSCYGAICVTQVATWLGCKGAAVIGAVVPPSYPTYKQEVTAEILNSVLLANASSPIKKRYLASLNFPAVESDEEATFTVRAVTQLVGQHNAANVVAKPRGLDTVEELSLSVLEELDAVARSASRETNPFAPGYVDEEEDVDDYDFPPPPPELLVPNTTEVVESLPHMDLDAVKAIWDEASHELSQNDPTFNDAMNVLNWLYRNQLVSVMAEYARADSLGDRFRRMMSNYVRDVPGVIRTNTNPTAAEAQQAKAARLYSSLVTQYPDITVEWIMRNGIRGPSTEQARVFRARGLLPDPGLTPEDNAADKTAAIVSNVLKGFTNATTKQVEQLTELVETIRKGPNPDQLRQIFGVGRGNLEKTIENTIANNRLNDDEASMVRRKIMDVQRGLTGEELAEIRGTQLRRKTRVERQPISAPIFTRPGGSSRLKRLLAESTELQ